MVPWIFLIASIASFLIFVWVLVYISSIYEPDSKQVLVTGDDENEEGK